MKKEIYFTLFTIKQNLKNKTELKFSFFASVIGMVFNNVFFVIVWMAFGTLAVGMNNWQPVDVLLMHGVLSIGYGLCYGFFEGIRNMPEIVSSGELDKYLLNPKNVLIRISTSTVSPAAIGDIVFGIISGAIWFSMVEITWIKFILFLVLSLNSALLFYFYSVLINSVAFYFHDSRSIVQGAFDLFLTPALFFGGAFSGLVRVFFIFIVPSLLLGALPAEIIKNFNWYQFSGIFLITFFWMIVSVLVFYKSIKKYESSNFIGSV